MSQSVNNPLNVLLIDDDPSFCHSMARVAKDETIYLEYYNSLLELSDREPSGQYDAAIVDYYLDQLSGLDVVRYLSTLPNDFPVLLISLRPVSDTTYQKWPNNIYGYCHKSKGPSYVIHKALDCHKDRCLITHSLKKSENC